MTNIGRKLALSGMATAPFFHNNEIVNTEFKYPGFHKTQYNARGFTKITQDSQTIGKRKSARFVVHQDSHFMGQLFFCGEFAPSQDAQVDENGTGGVAGLNNRLINFAPREMIDYIEFKAGKSAKRPVRISGRTLHMEHYITTMNDNLPGVEYLELGGLTDAERADAFQTQQKWQVSIKTPWDELSSHLPLNALQDDLIIEVFFKDDEHILCYGGIPAAGGVTVERENMYLRLEQYMFFTPAYNHNIEDIFSDNGIEYYKRDVEFADYVFGASDIVRGDKIEIPLKDFNHEVSAYYVTLRYETYADSDADPATNGPLSGGVAYPRGNYGYDLLEPWVEHEIRDNNMIVDEAIDHDFQVWHLNATQTMYPDGLNVIIHLNGHAVVDRQHVYGSHNPAGFQQGIFSITLTPDMVNEMTVNGENIVVQFSMLVHNKVSLISRTGDINNPRATLIELFQIN